MSQNLAIAAYQQIIDQQIALTPYSSDYDQSWNENIIN